MGRAAKSVLLVSASILMSCTGGEPSIDQARTAEAVERTDAIPGLLATLESDEYSGGVTVVEFRLDELRVLGDLVAGADADGGRLDAPVVATAWLDTTDPTPNTRAFIAAYRDDPDLEDFGRDRADRYAMGIGVTAAFDEQFRTEFEQHFASSIALDDFEEWLGTSSVTRTAIGSAQRLLNPE